MRGCAQYFFLWFVTEAFFFFFFKFALSVLNHLSLLMRCVRACSPLRAHKIQR